MKKLFSIGFLIIFLFNVGGYYLVFIGLKYQAKSQLLKQIEAQTYSAEEAIELKIPMSLPYELNQQQYERVDGEFAHEGRIYRLVKQKYVSDTLYLVCIPSHKEKLLQNVMSDYIKGLNDIPVSSKNALTLLVKWLKEYQNNFGITIVHSSGWHISVASYTGTPSVLENEIPVHVPPPKYTIPALA